VKFTLTIDSDSADLEAGGRETLGEILCLTADRMCETSLDTDLILDRNGNTVGNWVYENSKEDAE